MADPSNNPDTADDTRVVPARESATGTPRWVKVFGVVALVAVLLVVILLLTGRGGGHGPGRHALSGDPDGQTPPTGFANGEQEP